LDKTRRHGEYFWVDGGGDAGQAVEQRWDGWGVEEFVGDAEHSALADGAQVLPAALLDDALEGDAISGAAPCQQQNVGGGGGDLFRRAVLVWEPDWCASRGFY